MDHITAMLRLTIKKSTARMASPSGDSEERNNIQQVTCVVEQNKTMKQ